MKEVTLDVLGRVHIPKEFRERLGWQVESKVSIYTTEDKVVITKQAPIHKCPVCSKVFSAEYLFCPFCGQYLVENKQEEKLSE